MSLIEVLVVLAIIALLLGLILPAVQRVRSSAARAGCLNNMRQLGLALHNHQQTYGIFPPQNPSLNNSIGSTFSYEGIGWTVYLLPYLEQGPLWAEVVQAYAANPNPSTISHAGPMAQVVRVYVCPADDRLLSPLVDQTGISSGATAGYTSYVGMTGYLQEPRSGLFGRRNGATPMDIRDGLSNTVAIGERPPPGSLSMGWWYTTHPFDNLQSVNDFEVPADTGRSPGDTQCGGITVDWPGKGLIRMYLFGPGSLANECDKYHYWSFHTGGANFLFVDGSARFLTYAIRFQLRDFATIAGGEVVTIPD
jgi:prepilin-type processing-associated H-X9-DG protein